MSHRFIVSAVPIAALLAIFVAAGLIGGLAYPLDVHLVQTAQDWRAQSPQLTGAVILLTHMGSVYATLGGGLLIALWLGVTGHYHRAIPLAVAVIGERILMDGIKLLIDRARPAFDLHPVATHSASFPSGHAGNTMAVFLTVALIAAPTRWRLPAVILALTLSILIGLSRVYLGVHWPSDVIGGWALGATVAIIAARVSARCGLGTAEEEHEIIGGHRSPVDED